MAQDPDIDQIVGALRVSIGLLVRRLRQTKAEKAEGGVTLPETSALARLERDGPTTPSALARLEQISPQSMGATIGALEARGFVERRADPADGRRAVISPTRAGLQALRLRRNVGNEAMARALSTGFTRPEIDQLKSVAPLIERLAQSI